MDPNAVLKVTLDGKTHTVASRLDITIATQTGTVDQVAYADPADPNNIIMAEGRTSFQVTSAPGVRFTCNCGISYDAAVSAVDGTGIYDQAPAVDCPSC
jgi:hypothetical protein